MAMTDPLGDMLARIRNGQKARQAQIACPAAKLHTAVLSVLKDEGYIRGYADRDVRKGVRGAVPLFVLGFLAMALLRTVGGSSRLAAAPPVAAPATSASRIISSASSKRAPARS